jgi:hypothetical protein|tara:strand:+ start:81834 stop:82133 length:300 start_codon:yes stop_codon:yes gene_type:complete
MKNKIILTASTAALLGFAGSAFAQGQETMPDGTPMDPAMEDTQPTGQPPMTDEANPDGMSGPELDPTVDTDTDADTDTDVSPTVPGPQPDPTMDEEPEL